MDPRPSHRETLISTSSSLRPAFSSASSPRSRSPNDRNGFEQGAFLLRKTEITVKSAPAEAFSDDQSSDQASICSTVREERRGRSVLGRFSSRTSAEQNSIHSNDWRSSEDLSKTFDPLPLGTTVSIEAAQPVKVSEQKLHEMKGLEQAASMKRWAGEGRPADAWGKLMKDPELWDYSGDTLVYFGYQRPQASFRIKSALLEDTKSGILVSKLQEGFQRSAKLSPSRDHASALRGGMKNLSLMAKGRRPLATVSESGDNRNESPIQHEIHFPAPDDATRIEILRHHITTRNLFAFLLGKPLIGLTYYQALTDLHERLLLYMSLDIDSAQFLIRYLIKNNLHNVSNDPAAAVGLLAWIENHQIRWPQGWREAFVHCVGMYHDLRDVPEIRDISYTSRVQLERSYLELQARIEACESRLSAFNFDDMLPNQASPSPLSRRSFNRMRQFLRQHYEKAYKGWPPGATFGSNDHWLNRELVQRLQSDFGSLYDYLVDRDRRWDKAAELGIHEKVNVDCQDEDFDFTRLLLVFDNKHKYPHLPFPYPLLPATAANLLDGKPLKQSIFSTKAKTMEKRNLHSCAEASNALLVGAEIRTNSLVEAFLRFEKNDLVSEANPREVRQGRWVLLYGVLQVLAPVAVNTPGLWFRDTAYYLNPRLRGCPPWLVGSGKSLEEANPSLSYCWMAPKTWSFER
ncbi:MAG: hypothetical protein Q9216_005386 [Gyalolechia sp. 2 TL-2023]